MMNGNSVFSRLGAWSLLFTLLLIVAGPELLRAQGTWNPVGNPGFSPDAGIYTSLALDGGTPYVAYIQGGVTVMKYNGSSWVTVGSPGFGAGGGGGFGLSYLDLALDGGTPYVVYQDGGNGLKATVKKFDGSSWIDVGSPGFSAGDASYTSLALDGSTPYVAYKDGGNNVKTTVMKYNGSSWVSVGDPGFSAGGVAFTSLALDAGTPYVAYFDGAYGGKATVKKFDGSSWVDVGSPGFSAGPAINLNLALDGGTPYVAYEDGGNGNKATVMKYNGSSWVDVGSPGFSAGSVNFMSLALDGGTPYVAYLDGVNGSKATVMKYNGSSWVSVGDPGFSEGVSFYPSLALDGGTPYVAYQDGGYGLKATVMKFQQPPTDIALNPSSVDENKPTGTTAGTLSTTDPDQNDTFTYSLVSGAGDNDNASFTIDGNLLKSNAVFDFETQNSFSVRISSSDGQFSTEKAFTVTINDVNETPTANAGPNHEIVLGETVTLDGSNSTDPDSDPGKQITAYDWDFGDNTTGTGAVINHTYTVAGTYTVVLTVTDGGGLSDTGEATVLVKTPAEATQDLIALVEGLGIHGGTANSLTAKLENAIAKLQSGNTTAALGQLNAFINQAEAQRGKKLTDAQADQLIAEAQRIIAAINAGSLAKQSSDETLSSVPVAYQLAQNYPNPFNPTTSIRFSIPEAAQVQLTVYDISGREVRSLVSGSLAAGAYDIQWDATNNNGAQVASGIYIYRLQAGSFVQTRKMTLLR